MARAALYTRGTADRARTYRVTTPPPCSYTLVHDRMRPPMAVAAALLGAVGAAHASPPLAVSWAQLKLKTAKVSSPACVDSNSGGPKVDVYACVAPTAGNIDNELFALSATGQWLARACGLPSGRCPPTQTPKCVSPVACSGAASGLCLARCGNDTRWQKQGGAGPWVGGL